MTKAAKPVLRTAYNYAYENPPTAVEGVSLTEQHHLDSCDINLIMARYQKTGVIDHVSKYEPMYGEMDGATFLEKQRAITNVITMFEDLPSTAREHFGHDPAAFLDFAMSIDDKTDRSELVRAGLMSESDFAAQALIRETNVDPEAPQAVSEEPPEGDDC